jgi:hypothetical protein
MDLDDVSEQDELYAIGTANEVSEKMNLSTAVRNSELWLRNCKDSHPSCWESQRGILPTRVLDLEKDGEGSSVVLIETNGVIGRYMTLSHCWGATHPLTTTSTTINERKDGISLSNLPRTFKDFVDVAKGLGVRYVWIDSLCIIQDDAADWASEAGKMASVYSGSYLNIAGSSASGCQGGLFPSESTMDNYRLTKAYRIQTLKAERTTLCLCTETDYSGPRSHGEIRRWRSKEFTNIRERPSCQSPASNMALPFSPTLAYSLSAVPCMGPPRTLSRTPNTPLPHLGTGLGLQKQSPL